MLFFQHYVVGRDMKMFEKRLERLRAAIGCCFLCGDDAWVVDMCCNYLLQGSF